MIKSNIQATIFKQGIVILIIWPILAQCYVVELLPSAQFECFIEKLKKGETLDVAYEVIDGSPLYVDFMILDPIKQPLIQRVKSVDGQDSIDARLDGSYKICFRNQKSSGQNYVMFDTAKSSDELGQDDRSRLFFDDDGDKSGELRMMTKILLRSTRLSRKKARYLIARDDYHRKVNERTNSDILWWTVIELSMIAGVGISQVWYVKRFFEISRKI